jgi:pimeloyl-ACP methyl ester carboxylesterase
VLSQTHPFSMKQISRGISVAVFTVMAIAIFFSLLLFLKNEGDILNTQENFSHISQQQSSEAPGDIEGDFYTSDNVRIHYWYYNRGTSFVTIFLHGGPGSSSSDVRKTGQAERYADHFGSLLVFDQRGGGASERGTTVLNGKMSLDRFVQDINELRSAVIPDRDVIIFGRSFGGLLAARYANSNPKNVRGYILAAPGQFSSDNNLLQNQRDALVAGVGEEKMREVAAADRSAILQLHEKMGDVVESLDEEQDTHEDDIDVGSALVASGDYYSHEEFSLLPILNTIPTLVAFGSYDTQVPPLAIEAMKPYMPNASFVELPGGHGAAYTHEVEFFKAVQAFFDSIKE